MYLPVYIEIENPAFIQINGLITTNCQLGTSVIGESVRKIEKESENERVSERWGKEVI